MNVFLDLIIFFTLYSFLGWLIETVLTFREFKFIKGGFLAGHPFRPIYGFGAIIIIQSAKLSVLLFESKTLALFVSILISIFMVTALEYITGFLFDKLFNHKLWDYKDKIFNLHGYICLNYSLMWGLLAFILLQYVQPIVLNLVLTIEAPIKCYIGIITITYFAYISMKSYFKFKKNYRRRSFMPKKITVLLPDNVADHLEEIKKKLRLSTLSGTASLSIEILQWILEQQDAGFTVKAERIDGTTLIYRDLPLKR